MRTSRYRLRLWGGVVALVVALAALTLSSCVHDNPGPGAPNGPSEFGLAITLAASPDTLPLDGVAQSLIRILARDANGSVVSNLRLLLQISTSRGFEDFGRLSSRTPVTGSDGRAAVTYTVPVTSTDPTGAVDGGTTVILWVTPVGQDYSNATSRRVTIRLVPSGTVIPPFGATAGFTITPATPTVFDQVRFSTACPPLSTVDCVSDPNGTLTEYRWDFGDGATVSGRDVTHVYEVAGTYVVRLAIRDSFGRSEDASKTLVVVGGVAPTAVIAVSPTDPEPHDAVFFNGTGSTAAAGRTVVSYNWDFGDGSTASGATASHVYDIDGEFVVTLKVTDDQDQVGVATAGVSVVAVGPKADFVFSPTEPAPGAKVFFDATNSDAGSGRTTTKYRWNFGDGGASNTGPKTSHVFAAAGTYAVRLTVTNNVGEFDVTDQDVLVEP